MNLKQLSEFVMLYALLMHYFPSDRKVTNQMLVRKKHEKTFNGFEIFHTKEAKVRNTFQ